MGSFFLYCFVMRERDGDYPHYWAHLVPLPRQKTRRDGRKLPDRNRSGCNRHNHRERLALFCRTANLLHSFHNPTPRPDHHQQYCLAGLRTYLSPEWKFSWT